MNVCLMVVPYDSGRRGYRMGGGPLHLQTPVANELAARGHPVSAVTLESAQRDAANSSFDLARQVAGHVSVMDIIRKLLSSSR
jgi:hypothetical protein